MTNDRDKQRTLKGSSRPRRPRRRWYQKLAFLLTVVRIARLVVGVVRWFD